MSNPKLTSELWTIQEQGPALLGGGSVCPSEQQ